MKVATDLDAKYILSFLDEKEGEEERQEEEKGEDGEEEEIDYEEPDEEEEPEEPEEEGGNDGEGEGEDEEEKDGQGTPGPPDGEQEDKDGLSHYRNLPIYESRISDKKEKGEKEEDWPEEEKDGKEDKKEEKFPIGAGGLQRDRAFDHADLVMREGKLLAARIARKIRLPMRDNHGSISGQREGMLDENRMIHAALGSMEVFKKKLSPSYSRYLLYIVMDRSDSMRTDYSHPSERRTAPYSVGSHPEDSVSTLARILQVGFILSAAKLEGLDVHVAFFPIHHITGETNPKDLRKIRQVAGVPTGGTTPMHAAMKVAERKTIKLAKKGEYKGIIMALLTDGCPDGGRYGDEEIENMQKAGVSVIKLLMMSKMADVNPGLTKKGFVNVGNPINSVPLIVSELNRAIKRANS